MSGTTRMKGRSGTSPASVERRSAGGSRWGPRRLGAWLRLHFRAAASLLSRKEEGFAEIEQVHRISPGSPLFSAEEVGRWVFAWMGAFSHLGWRAGCLRRSLTLAEVLRREGHDARVVLGARRQDGGFSGHCWVEVNGREMGRGPGRHAVLWRSGERASGRG